MLAARSIAGLAIALSLIGCAANPTSQIGAGRSVFTSRTPILAQGSYTIAEVKSEENTRLEDLPSDQQARILKRHMAYQSHHIKRLFNKLEKANPELAPKLEKTKHRILGLSHQERAALRAAIWKENKDKTLAQFHEEIKGMLKKPENLIKAINTRIDSIEGMSAMAQVELANEAPNDLMTLLEPKSTSQTGTTPATSETASALKPANFEEPAE